MIETPEGKRSKKPRLEIVKKTPPLPPEEAKKRDYRQEILDWGRQRHGDESDEYPNEPRRHDEDSEKL